MPFMVALIVLGILLYFAGLVLVLAFLAGAATVNRRWDKSNRALFRSDRNHEDAA